MDASRRTAVPRWLRTPNALPGARWVVGMALFVGDAALFVDAAVRWHFGFTFARSEGWWHVALGMAALSMLSAWVLLRRPSIAVLHFAFAAVFMYCLFLTAGTANGKFDWRTAPPTVSLFSMTASLAGALVSDHALTIILGSLYHTVWGWFARRVIRRPASTWMESLLFTSGVTLVLLSLVSDAEFLIFYDPLVGERIALEPLHVARERAWQLVGCGGALLATLGALLAIVRVVWLARVARGRSASFALREPPDPATADALPVFFRRPFGKRTRLLVARREDHEQALARVVM